MTRTRSPKLALFVATLAAVTTAHALGQQPPSTAVDDVLLRDPPEDVWIGYGRDYAETHHSPLTQVDKTRVSRLGLLWSAEVGSDAKIETTPIVWNGVLYGTSSWSVVYAVDIKTGSVKWRWDPALVRGG